MSTSAERVATAPTVPTLRRGSLAFRSFEKRARRQRLTTTQYLEQLYLRQHLTLQEIGALFGVTNRTVQLWMRALGMPGPREMLREQRELREEPEQLAAGGC